MEFPSYHHHHNHHRRYVPPPPPNNFSDDHLYPHHHHLQQPPPTPLPPPPPPSYPSLPPPPPPPPPPPYNPQQSHFTFLNPLHRSTEDDSFFPHRRSSPPQPPPRFSSQSHRLDYRPEYRPDSWSDPPRVPPELPHRHRILPDDEHHRPYSPYRPSERYYKPPDDLERIIPSGRYRDDFIDGYASRDSSSNVGMQEKQQAVLRGSRNDDDDNYHNRRLRNSLDRFVSANSKRYSRDVDSLEFDVGLHKGSSSSSRNLEDYVEKYEPRYPSVVKRERSWDRRDEDGRWTHAMGEKIDFDRGGDDGISFVSAREDLRGYVSGKSSREREKERERERERDWERERERERDWEREREDREEFKQVQKKSVLLRIGKPNNAFRNRSHEQNFSKAYVEDSNNSNFRVKDKDKDSSLYSDQKMEGDREGTPVVLDVSFKSNALVAKAVATPSSPASDNNFTPPRNRKIRKATEFESPLSKYGEHSTRSDSSSHGSEFPSSSEKGSRQPRKKGSTCDGGSMGACASVPCTGATNDTALKSMDVSSSDTVLDQGGGSGGSDGPLSFRLRKKRKVINLSSCVSIFHANRKDDEPVNGESSKDSPSEPNQGAISCPFVSESIVSKVDESPQANVSGKDGSEFETVKPCQLDSERNTLTNVDTSLSPMADRSVPNLQNTDISDHDVDAEKTLTELKGSSVCDDMVNVLGQQHCQNEVLPFLENNTPRGSIDDKASLGCSDFPALSTQIEVENQNCPTESFANDDTTNNFSSSCTISNKTQEISTIADTNPSAHCLDESITILPEYVNVQGFVDDLSRKEEETKLLEHPSNADSCNMNSGVSTTPDSCLMDTQMKKVVSESCGAGNTSKQSCFGGAGAVLPEDGSGESPKAIADDNPTVISGQPSETCQSETSENVERDVDATPSNSIKESSCDEEEVTEMGNLISAAVEIPDPDEKKPSTDDGSHLILEDYLLPASRILSACADGNCISTTNSNGTSVHSMCDMPNAIVSSQNVPSSSDSRMLTSKSSDLMISHMDIPTEDESIHEESVSKGGSLLNSPELVYSSRNSMKVAHEGTDLSANTKTATSAYQGSHVTNQSLNTKMQGLKEPVKQPIPANAVPRTFPGRSSLVFTNSRINAPANNITKPRTWHRTTSNPAPGARAVAQSSSIPVSLLPPKKVGMGQNSYIRSGNTLVRKGAPVTPISNGSPALKPTVYQLNPSGTNDVRNSASGSKVHNTYSRTGGSNASVVRPPTPPLSGSNKLSDCTRIYSGDLPSSPLERPISGISEETSAPIEGILAAVKVSDYQKASGTLEDQAGIHSNYESQKTPDEVTIGKSIRYVKRKSNQLVAASSTDQSVQDVDKTQASSSDGYYKRRKNQLIRTMVGDDSLNSEVQRASNSDTKRQAGRGMSKKSRHLRSSVWTLDSQSSRKDGIKLRHKVSMMPQLFPWKRARYWGNLMSSTASISNNNSLYSISRKLLLTRKRDIVYTRSSHGFSLRMSKLLSVGGSSLKWSKSIERNSKKANEEATLAVVAAEKKKREQHGTACPTAEIKSRNNMSRDRIFRIGLVRYKMDPSRRTLQRISDEDSSTGAQSKTETKRSYFPKRLLIGHDEYVRIGNGNQLVRNPKRRTRIFASEKVRWSLHTARSRLARKRKYCQFFTRFGKCNKDDGKCPFIHDPSKIAVCTKFLNGSCFNPDCKLTHKVIPERMQDCSYFLQGLCSNEHCPYRHVNVNLAASVCEGFLKGYCSDGNECRKKHTYACPVFEATGACPQGSKCKLHHPKNRNKGLKRKLQHSVEQHQKNSRGRYFGSFRGVEVTDSAMPMTEKHYPKNNGDIFLQEGKFAEYIGLDFSNEEAGDSCDVASEQRIILSSDPSVVKVSEFEDLIKPIGIMHKNVMKESPILFDCPGERTASSLLEDTTDCCKVG